MEDYQQERISYSNHLPPADEVFFTGSGIFSQASDLTAATFHRSSDGSMLRKFSIVDDKTSSQLRSERVLEELSINKLRFDGSKLYGRDEEVQKLQDILEATCVTKEDANVTRTASGKQRPTKNIVWISGAPGCGKTSLASSVQRHPVFKRGGLLGKVKFDLQHKDVPFFGVKHLMDSLMQQLLLLAAHERAEEWVSETTRKSKSYKNAQAKAIVSREIRRAMKEELVNELPFLVKFFPSIRFVLPKSSMGSDAYGESEHSLRIDTSDKHDSISSTESNGKRTADTTAGSSDNVSSLRDYHAASNQLKYSFINLMAVLGRHAQGLVMVFDDVQWADAGSMELIQRCMMETTVENVMVIGCYRDNHPLDHTWNRLESSKEKRAIGVASFHLDDLSTVDIEGVLMDLLSEDQSAVNELAQILHEKTQGNAFYLQQLLKDLERRQLLSFTIGDMKWHWDIQEIAHNAAATENVVDLIYKSIQHSQAAMRILPIASCLGAVFSMGTLKILLDAFEDEKSEHSPFFCRLASQANLTHTCTSKDLENLLEQCVEEGFIICVQDTSYAFVHDRVQQGCASVLSDPLSSELRFQVAAILSHKLKSAALQSSVFTILSLFESCKEEHAADAKLLFDLYCLAGRRASASSANSSALHYFKTAVELLPSDSWLLDRKGTCDLLSNAAQAAYCQGDLELTNRYCDIVINHKDLTPCEKSRCYRVQITTLGSLQHKAQEAVKVGLEALKLFGMSFPGRRSLTLNLILGMMRMKSAKKLVDSEFMLSLPDCEDTEILAIADLIDSISPFAYEACPNLFPLLMIKQVELSAKHGTTKSTASSMVAIGFILIAVMSEFTQGRQFADTAMALLHKSGSERTESGVSSMFLANSFIYQWSQHFRTLLMPLRDTYRLAMSLGKTQDASFAAFFYIDYSLYSGTNLVLLDHTCQSYAQQMSDYHQELARNSILVDQQACQNLIGKGTQNTTTLSGGVMKEEDQIVKMGPVGKGRVERMRLWLCLYFGEYELGSQVAFDWGDKALKQQPGMPNAFYARLSGAVCCYEMARKTNARKYLREAKRLHKIITGWTQHSPNCYHHELLLDAEAAAYKRHFTTYNKFETAILVAGRRGYLPDHALGNELFATYCAETGDFQEAEFRANAACRLYEEWGAARKVKLLQEFYKKEYPSIVLEDCYIQGND